jgi:hypothetical protein
MSPIELFETSETTKRALAKNLTELFDTYGLKKINLIYVKDEGFNINSMTIVLKLVVNCEALRFEESY